MLKIWLATALPTDQLALAPRVLAGLAYVRLQFGIAGLPVACELLKAIADKYDGVSYADLFQMASAQAIEASLPDLDFYIAA